MSSRARAARQLSFAERRRSDGKVREKPGRKAGARAGVPHVARPVHKRWNPLHVTLRALPGLPSFREQTIYLAFERSVRDTRRDDFRIVEFSIQKDHVHLIVEADDKDALARGMKSFSVRANRLFNAASLRGRGRVWRGRYHRSDLTTPRQVRTALVYCLNNGRKHGVMSTNPLCVDACSSARWFTGWSLPRTVPDAIPTPALPARTMLLRELWKRYGLLHPAEAPAAPRPAARPRRPSMSRWA